MTDKYISVSEFANKFNVSTTLVYKLIREGHVPAVKIGERNYRISPKTVEGIENCGLLDK